MNKLLILLMLVAHPASALTAKEALVQTEASKVKIEKQKIQDEIDARKERIDEIQSWINAQVKQGYCTYQSMWTYNPSSVAAITDHFTKLGYKVTTALGKDYYPAMTEATISWCEAK